ncbi:MAG TPA: dienelactone hydrolase [Porticoccaceae bacterium]|nr:dienelactone hydrolase [Porticoccaceae bacterium]
MRYFTALIILSFLFILSSNTHAVHECGSPHEQENSAEHEKHGCDDLVETDFFYGDSRGDSPELASRGSYKVGVRTLELVNPNQPDVINYSTQKQNSLYDRQLTIEVWYPAKLNKGQRQITIYSDVLGHGSDNPDRPNLPFHFGGRAARNAVIAPAGSGYPLVIISHGYPGSRVMMTWLAENLASKGYVVVAIDHAESTHADAESISSTMVHRPRDITFVVNAMDDFNQKSTSFLFGRVNAELTALIGYSMGTYGTLSMAGVGASKLALGFPGDIAEHYLTSLQAGNPEFEATIDRRIKAMIAFSPFAPSGYWSQAGIKNLKVPSLFVVGDQDQTTGFSAAQWLFDNAVNSHRYLLVFKSAIHEVATNPAPPLANLYPREYAHYQEPAWDNRRLNNINQHFITAFLGKHLLGEDSQYSDYLNLSVVSNDSPRTDTEDSKYWKGFANWTAIGMELHQREANTTD